MLFIEGDQEEELELAEGVLLPVAQQVAKTKTNALYDLLFFIAPDVRKYRIHINISHPFKEIAHYSLSIMFVGFINFKNTMFNVFYCHTK